MNQTAIVNGIVTFECPVVSDIAAHITWAKYFAFNDTDINSVSHPNIIELKVYLFIKAIILIDDWFIWRWLWVFVQPKIHGFYISFQLRIVHL